MFALELSANIQEQLLFRTPFLVSGDAFRFVLPCFLTVSLNPDLAPGVNSSSESTSSLQEETVENQEGRCPRSSSAASKIHPLQGPAAPSLLRSFAISLFLFHVYPDRKKN